MNSYIIFLQFWPSCHHYGEKFWTELFGHGTELGFCNEISNDKDFVMFKCVEDSSAMARGFRLIEFLQKDSRFSQELAEARFIISSSFNDFTTIIRDK